MKFSERADVAESERKSRSKQRRSFVRDPEGARRALLDSAIHLFEQFGYAATSVQRVVDRAGLTKGAFYHHFSNKDDLLLQVHDEFIDFQLERARTVVADPDLGPDERLHRLITEALLEPLSVYKSEITVFIQERRFLSGEVFAEVQAKRDEFERYFVDVIEQGMREGVFRQVGPARLVAFGIIGMGAWTHVWLDAEGPTSPTEIGNIYGSLLLDGLLDAPTARMRRLAKRKER